MTAPRISARERLLALPDVFSVSELSMLHGFSALDAARYAFRWKAAGLVAPLGGKSGIMLNLVRQPMGATDEALWHRAILKAMPSAVIGGYQVLSDSGVTTQITHQRYVLVANSDSKFDVDGTEVHRRPVPWLNRLVREGAMVCAEPGVTLPRLRPGAALADLALYGESKPDPDDLDMDSLEPEEVDLFRRLSRAESVASVAPKRRPRMR